MTWILITLATLIISLGSLAGVMLLAVKNDKLEKFLLALIGLSAGSMLGGAFFHLLPEAIEGIGSESALAWTLAGLVLFAVVEKVLHWRHCHHGHCEVHSFGHLNLIGDAVHNFLDGIVIAAAFSTSWTIGWVTTVIVALHEIPQEIGDFGVLLYAGYSKLKALAMNLLVSLTAVAGGWLGYWFLSEEPSWLLALAAGGFIYIAASDLLPEIRKNNTKAKLAGATGLFALGLLLVWLAKLLPAA